MVYVLYPAMSCAAACVDRGNGADEKKQSFGEQMYIFGIGAGYHLDFADFETCCWNWQFVKTKF